MNRNRHFVCPGCYRGHRTLGALLVCCPRQLRAVTGQLHTSGSNSFPLGAVLTGQHRQWTDLALGRRPKQHRPQWSYDAVAERHWQRQQEARQ